MQNFLLLHLREQKRLTAKQMRKTTHCNTDAEVLSALLKVKPACVKSMGIIWSIFLY
jgi:hypothetical protein